MPFDRLTVFWVAMGISLLLFLLGLGIKISFWSQGQVRDAHGRLVERNKAWHALLGAFRFVFSRRFGRLLGMLWTEGLWHRQLKGENLYRWAIHALMLFGFLIMFALSIITGFFEEILNHFYGVDTPLVRFFINKDTPFIALANEVLGIMILAGLLLAILRRFVGRPAQLRTSFFDTQTLVLLAFILLTGYPIQSFRLIMENTPPGIAWYSFLGYPLSTLLRPLDWNWPMWHYWTFMAHVGGCFILLVRMPFSKFFHVLISPIVATANRFAEYERGMHA